MKNGTYISKSTQLRPLPSTKYTAIKCNNVKPSNQMGTMYIAYNGGVQVSCAKGRGGSKKNDFVFTILCYVKNLFH